MTDKDVLVEDVGKRTRATVLRVVRAVATWVGTPVLVFAIGHQAWTGNWGAALVLEGVVHAAALALLWWPRLQERTRGVVLVCYLVLLGIAILAHYGPLLGVAAILLGALLAGIFWFPRWGVTATLAGMVAGMAAVMALVLGPGERVMLPVPEPDFADPLIWGRAGATFLVGAIGLSALLSYVLRSWQSALRRSRTARERERIAVQEQRRTAEALERSQRLEAVGRLAGGVAHDLNNVLTVIMTSAEMAKRVTDDCTKTMLVDDILEASRTAATTASQLLAFSRRGVPTSGRSDPAAVVERMGETLRRWLPDNVRVLLDTEPAPLVPLAVEQLEQVLLNLAINGRDAMPGGGELRLRVRAPSPEDVVIVEVEDEGVGMDEDTVQHAFEPFFTTKERDQGCGLGLSMVHGTVTAVGGSVDVRSDPGDGTRVRLVFPPVSAEAEAAEPAPAGPTTGSILVVEDQDDVREVIARTLREDGFEVTEEPGVEEALAVLRAGARFDLLLTDGVMPGTPTHELIDAFEEMYPAVPVVVCSGHVDDELVRQGIETGRFDLLAKPFGVDALRQKVRSVLRGRA